MRSTKNAMIVTVVSTLFLAGAPAGAQHRGGGHVRGGTPHGAVVGRAVPRGAVYPVHGGGAVGGSPYYRPYYAYSPYYTFRPHFSIGFGFSVGYPVVYPYFYGSYGYPYGYSYPPPYAYGYPPPYGYGYPGRGYAYPPAYAPGYPAPGYAPPGYPPSGYPSSYGPATPPAAQSSASGAVSVQRGAPAPSGVSFEVTPDNATVLVDGAFVGAASEFGPRSAPLRLVPGRHHIELRASGYKAVAFEADVTAGQITPFQGALQSLSTQ